MDCISSLWDTLALAAAPSATASRRSSHPRAADGNVDLLCLGSGWTWTFLGALAGGAGLSTAFTTRAGGGGAIPFQFDPESDDPEPFRALPNATTVVVVFPIYKPEGVKRLIKGYLETRTPPAEEHGEKAIAPSPHFIQLGSTGIWDNGPTFASLASGVGPQPALSLEKSGSYRHRPHDQKHKPSRGGGGCGHHADSVWKDRHSPFAPVPRAEAEAYLLSLNKPKNAVRAEPVPTSVLNLSGLWGHGRSPRRYITRIAPTKEALAGLGSVHLVHGRDVARALLAMHRSWDRAGGQRWLLTNERVYDLWDLCSRWGSGGEEGRNRPPQGPQPGWVQELIAESRKKSSQDEVESLDDEDPSEQDGAHETKSKPKPHGPKNDPRVVRSLPRSVEQMGSALDGTEFWSTFGITPEVPWVD